MIHVKFKLVNPIYGINPIPKYQTDGSAGCDLVANVSEVFFIKSGQWRMVPTGIAVELPPYVEGQVRSRSGIARKYGLTVLNSPGTIDSDYRGEVCVILKNNSNITQTVEPGERIAQLVFAYYKRADFELVEELGQSERGSGGFGSTGGRS